MKNNKYLIKKRLLFFISNIVVVVLIVSKIFSDKLLPVFIEYGEYQCASISTRIINHVISNQISDGVDNQIVTYNNSDVASIDFNTSILNSISSNSIRKMQKYLYICVRRMTKQTLI